MKIALVALLLLVLQVARNISCAQFSQDDADEMRVTGGEFTTPNWPDNYTANLNLNWTLTAPDPDAKIYLSFDDFDTEPSYDFVTVRDGAAADAPTLIRHAGTVRAAPCISSGNSLHVNFKSDARTHHKGFRAVWAQNQDREFQEERNDSNGSISSPHYPNGPYPANMTYNWIIRSHLPDALIQLTFINMNIESDVDFVEIRDGDNDKAELLRTITGYSSGRLPSAIASGNALHVKFRVNSANPTRTGFRAIYETIETVIVHDRQSVTLNSYGANADMSWIFQSYEESVKLTVFFGYSHVREGYDYFEVREGGLSKSPLLYNFTGTVRIDPLEIVGSKVYFRLRAHAYNNYGQLGFHVVVNKFVKELSGATYGSIANPGNAGYVNDADYTWHISIPAGRVFLTISYDTLENVDFVQVRDGKNSTSPVLGIRSGTQVYHENRFLTTGSDIYVRFTSKDQKVGGSFGAYYSSVIGNTNKQTCEGECTLTPPNYPLDSPHSLNPWAWELVSSGKFYILTFHELDTVEPGDYITIRDGWTTGAPLLGSFWGKEIPPVITSNRSGLLIQYFTNAVNASKGFRATTITKFWSDLVDPEGDVVTSVYYPEKYYPWATQTWLLKCPASRVHFVFHDFNMTRYDSVQFRNGNSSNSPLIRTFTGNLSPTPIYSTSEQLYVHFSADGAAVTTQGFKATFVCATRTQNLSGNNQGEITSPHYPQNYSNGLNQTWIITVPGENRAVVLGFEDFDTEEFADYLEIRDGNSADSPLLDKLSGGGLPTYSLRSSSNSMYINFQSDEVRNSTGFKLHYFARDMSTTELK